MRLDNKSLDSINNMSKLLRMNHAREHVILCSDSEEDALLTDDDKYDKLEVSLLQYCI